MTAEPCLDRVVSFDLRYWFAGLKSNRYSAVVVALQKRSNFHWFHCNSGWLALPLLTTLPWSSCTPTVWRRTAQILVAGKKQLSLYSYKMTAERILAPQEGTYFYTINHSPQTRIHWSQKSYDGSSWFVATTSNHLALGHQGTMESRWLSCSQKEPWPTGTTTSRGDPPQTH